ncbi:hypothetical protein EXIGLDRAFT_667661 [Exidia glandulosa HHB12029]|uniref:Sister chromatid cohesion protein DCC1 n=1 Tax=Exidia glandulosa HHB12029 TaxID=1314781 RepID=A0A165N6G2_EXIGL|nr:hypothetical protein EXIGLDRAFT_667661 [Exidia glandulosa HHB12029]
MTIKGRKDDDAVICTEDKTYTLRAVVLSNSFLVVTPPATDADAADLVIRDQVSQILELVPTVPKIAGRLNTLLRDSEYREGLEDESDGEDEDARPTKRRRVSYDEVLDCVQASNAELEQSLQSGRVLHMRGELRPLERGYLAQMLKLLLNAIVAQKMSPDAALIDELVLALQEHDVPREVTTQILPWFGTVEGNKWKVNVAIVAQEIGVSILQTYQHESVLQESFMAKWADAVGEAFAASLDLQLLEGNYVQSHIFARSDESQDGAHGMAKRLQLTYLPSASLPMDPGLRFNDLFLVKPKWRADELVPFLKDIAIDAKARDKLFLKWCRATTDADGAVWYTVRAKHI